MSAARGPQTAAQVHAASEAGKRERKRERRARGEIHAAMEKAHTMKRSRKKGTANLDDNMAALGWQRVAPNVSDGATATATDVLDKFQRRST